MSRERRWEHRAAGSGLEAEKTVRKPPEPFGVLAIGDAGRVRQRVGQPPADGGQPGGPRIAAVGDLNRRGPAGEGEQAIAGGMAGQIHEDIYPVFDDLSRQSRVGQVADVAPAHRAGHRRGSVRSPRRAWRPSSKSRAPALRSCAAMIGSMNDATECWRKSPET